MLSLSPESLSSLTQPEKEELVKACEALDFRWSLRARDKQRIPGGEDWDTWLIKAGRGFGKTRTGSEATRTMSQRVPLLHIIGRTAADARDVMVEGPSGILAVHPPWNKPKYEPSKRRITWPNGCRATVFSGDEPDLLRGPECYWMWIDELAAFKYAEETLDNATMGNRLGSRPWALITTTPRATPIIKNLIKDPMTFVTSGSTYENEANLSGKFLRKILDKYEGTRVGRQEIYAEILEDVEGALWGMDLISKFRRKVIPDLVRIVVAIDPATTSKPDSDETGIVVAGKGTDGHGYVLDDVSGIYTPSGWARAALTAYYQHQADGIIGEANNGGDMIEEVIRMMDSDVNYHKVTATRGKVTRAEPVVSLYEQGRIHHVGSHPDLETQMTTWAAKKGEKSPDRVDALVWALTELMLNDSFEFYVV